MGGVMLPNITGGNCMKFFGCGIVWNPEKDCELCRFKKTGLRKGELETNDPALIETLKKAGYKYELTEKDLEEAKKNKKQVTANGVI